MSTYRSLAEVLNNNETQSLILPGLVQKYLQTNELMAWMNTIIVDRPSITVPYVADYGAVTKGGDCSTAYTSVAISGGNDVFNLVKYATQFSTCLETVGLGSSFVSQASEDLLGAVKRMTNELAVDAVQGSGSGEVYGIEDLTTDVVGASTVGGSGSLEAIWYLFDEVKAKSDKMALVMNAKTKRRVMSEILSSAEVTTQEIKGSSFLVPYFNGAAILVSDASTDGRVTLLNGATDEGTFLAIGEMPGNNVGGVFNLIDVGISQTIDARLMRLAGYFAMVRKSRQGLAAITGW